MTRYVRPSVGHFLCPSAHDFGSSLFSIVFAMSRLFTFAHLNLRERMWCIGSCVRHRAKVCKSGINLSKRLPSTLLSVPYSPAVNTKTIPGSILLLALPWRCVASRDKKSSKCLAKTLLKKEIKIEWRKD